MLGLLHIVVISLGFLVFFTIVAAPLRIMRRREWNPGLVIWFSRISGIILLLLSVSFIRELL